MFKIATIGGNVTEQITSEVYLFGSMMQQHVIENELNREYAPLATIQPCVAIEFTVKGANDLYLTPEQLAPVYTRQDHQSGQNEHRREHSSSNQPDASLNVLRKWAGVKRSKCYRHEPAVPVSLTPGNFSEL